MSVETEIIRNIPPELAFITIAYIAELWKRLKERRSGNPNDHSLEIDHILPRYRGGTDAEENLQALSKPEHALKHHMAAEAETNKKYKEYEKTAVRTIVQRMTKAELKEFNRMLKKGGG